MESKNKDVITRGDLDKFVRDIECLAGKHTDDFIGAVFVSANSMNIPGKGSFTFEIIARRLSSSHKQLVMATAMGQYDIVKEIIITEFLGNTDSIEKIPYFNVNATWVMDDEDADVEVN